jgi:hypothetical protein
MYLLFGPAAFPPREERKMRLFQLVDSFTASTRLEQRGKKQQTSSIIPSESIELKQEDYHRW